MTRDPAEGVDTGGYLVTGASVARIPAVYRPVLADCVRALVELAGDRLDGLYLYGSVATGQARPPGSDLDLLALWTAPVDGVGAVAAALSARHRAVVREVGLVEAVGLPTVADRCFLKHYCVPLHGRDRRPELPRCRPDRALADGFNDDLPTVVRGLRAAVDAARTEAELAAAGRRTARRLLLAVATIESVSHAVWSTDRGAALLAEHHPQWTVTARRALDWVAGAGTPTRAEVEELLALGDWLTRHP